MTTDLVIRTEADYLAICEEIGTLVERIKTIPEAKEIVGKAAAARAWAQRASLGREQINLATAAKLWAERRAGELLAESKARGERASGHGDHKAESSCSTPLLVDLGINRDESSRFQRLARIPRDKFQRAVDESARRGTLTAAAVIRATTEDAPPPTYAGAPPEAFHNTKREIRGVWGFAIGFRHYDISENLRKMPPPEREELIERLIEARQALDEAVAKASALRAERPRLSLAGGEEA